MSDVLQLTDPRPLASGWSRLTAYGELTKPRIAVLALVATGVGYLMAVDAGPGGAVAARLIHTLVGTALVAAGANALNQVLERSYDAVMLRTAGRPLPSGRLTPQEAAWFGAVSGLLGLLYLSLFVNSLASAVAAFAYASYVFAYTPMKRWTSLSVLVGAVPGALPPVIGWAGGAASLSAGSVLLFGIVFFWQLPHFAAIAWQYRDDYARAGYPFLPVVDQEGTRVNLHVVTHSVALTAASLLPIHLGLAGPLYGTSALLLGLGFLACGIQFLRRKTVRSARLQVLASIIYLPVLLTCMLLDKVG